MAKTTVPGLYIADGAITAAKLSSTLDLSGVTITVATASTGDNDTTVASTAFVQQEIAALVDSSPSALNTLNELAAAIGDDASFSTTVTNSIATKLALAGGTMTGDLIINTTGSLQIPVGTTAQRPTAAQGQLRFNTTTSKPEIYNGSAWADVGGGVESVNSATGVVVLTTANIAENTNLYYTDARADARIAAADTDDLSEGSTNLYFTTARANSAIDGRLSGSTGVTVSNGAISIGQDVATSTSPTFQNLTLSGTDSVKVPSGTTAQRSGSPANGMLRYNSSTNEFEGYANSAWGAIGGDTTSSVDLYTATGNGSTATYDTGKNPQSENNTWVFIGGVYQPKSTYSFSGTEITLSENLPNGEDLEVITGTVSTYNPTDAILGQYNVTTSNTASYDTSLTTENENNVFVFVDGVYQPKSSYTYSGSTLTLDAVPTSGMSLEVLVTRSMNAATVTTGFLADDAVTTAKITDANVTAAKLASSLDLTGKTVTVATASAGDNDTSVASTAFVRQEITSLVDSAPAAMDTLNELAAALGDDANFSTTVNASIAAKLPLAGGTMTGDLSFGDNVRLEVGSAVGGDLQIYHDGSNSFIDETGTGNLLIRAGNLQLQRASGTQNFLAANTGAEVILYHAGNPKLATTSTGIDVTGTATMDGLTVQASSSATLKLESTTTTLSTGESLGGIDFYSNDDSNVGVKARINTYSEDTVGSTSLRFKTTTGFSTALKDRLNIASNGDISFYEDTGSTAKFFWDASAERLGIGTSSPATQFHIVNADDAVARIESNGSESSDDARLEIKTTNGTFTIQNDRSLGTSGALTFAGNTSDNLVIDHNSGNVGIGTSSPNAPLEINGGTAMSGGWGRSLLLRHNFPVMVFQSEYSTDAYAGIGYDNTTGMQFMVNSPTIDLFANSQTPAMIILDNKNVGIGITDPDQALEIGAGGKLKLSRADNARSMMLFTDNDNATIQSDTDPLLIQSANRITFNTNGANERMRIHTSGCVGIGSTADRSIGTNITTTVINGSVGGGLWLSAGDSSATSSFIYSFLNGSVGRLIINQGTGVGGGDIHFTFNESSTPTMILQSNKNVLIGDMTSDFITYGKLQVAGGGYTAGFGGIVGFFDTDVSVASSNLIQLLQFKNDTDATGGQFIRFSDSNSTMGSVSAASGTTVSYNTSSDRRMKENIVDASSQLDVINNIQIREFDWIKNGHHEVGVIAQELNEVIPNVVQEGGEDVNEEPWGVDYGKLTPYLIKAMQEQQTIIDDLKARLDEAGL